MLSATLTRRSQEDILEDVRSCITSLANVAQVFRLRSAAADTAERALVEETILDLHRLGSEARGLSRESPGQAGGSP